MHRHCRRRMHGLDWLANAQDFLTVAQELRPVFLIGKLAMRRANLRTNGSGRRSQSALAMGRVA